jgi:hypothetical protein
MSAQDSVLVRREAALLRLNAELEADTRALLLDDTHAAPAGRRQTQV